MQDSDTLVTNPDVATFIFFYKRVKYDGTVGTDLQQSVGLANKSYEALRQEFKAHLIFHADGSSAVAPDSDTVARFPWKLEVRDSSNVVRDTFEHVGETMLDLKFSQKVSFVNKTKNDAGNYETMTTGQNPLKGKLYQFSHSAPRLLDHFDVANRAEFQNDETLGVFAFTPVEVELAHPLDAKYWLK
ncbi:hypothetical protein N8134_04940, partial [Flavobacteriales bacterium]|nr:hypothetical protein [Flavobacteriales bacterium]